MYFILLIIIRDVYRIDLYVVVVVVNLYYYKCKLIDEGGTHDVYRYTGLWCRLAGPLIIYIRFGVPYIPARCMQVSPTLLTHLSDGKLSSMTCEGSRMGQR